MGILISRINGNITMHDKIEEELNKLKNEYEYWTFEEICPDIEILYEDKLMKLEKNKIDGIAGAIGIRKKDNIPKEELCKKIICHFKKQIKLIDYILKGINMCKDMTFKVNNGGVCIGIDSYIKTIEECDKYEGTWFTEESYKQLINAIKKDPKYKKYTMIISKLKSEYTKYLNKVKVIVNNLRSGVYTMKYKQFKDFYNYSKETVRRMVYICEIYYLMAINLSLIE